MENNVFGKSLEIYYCGSEICEKAHSFGPAVRTHYLLHFVVNGKGVYHVNDKHYMINSGEGFLIKPGELTTYTADFSEPWEYMWVAFDGYEVREILNKCNINYTMKAEDKISFTNEFQRLLDIFDDPNFNNYNHRAVFYNMISQLVKQEKNLHGSYDKIYFSKASDYIHNNFMYGISVNDVAKFVGIDRTYLYKVFIANAQQSPKIFLNSIKINAAKNMIMENKFTLNQIALSCGFIDAPALCKHFKKETGKTPKQFIKEINNSFFFGR
ncbi:MAG: AraC family transcriptional regulator [Clostridia bacterium]